MSKVNVVVCGIDPGRHGGIIFMTPAGELCTMLTMPEDTEWLADYLTKFLTVNPDTRLKVFIEKAQAHPGQGVVSVFNYARHYGELLGIFKTLQVTYTEVAPQTWTADMHKGFAKGIDPKKKSLEIVQCMFPKQSFLATPRSRKPHEGLIDAIMIAEWGRRNYYGFNQHQQPVLYDGSHKGSGK